MSSPELRLVLTRKARRDLQGIANRSLEMWGEEQQSRYLAALERGLTLLVGRPGIGRSRDDLRQGIRSHPIEQHIVLYTVSGTTLTILRVLHHRQNVRRAL